MRSNALNPEKRSAPQILPWIVLNKPQRRYKASFVLVWELPTQRDVQWIHQPLGDDVFAS